MRENRREFLRKSAATVRLARLRLHYPRLFRRASSAVRQSAAPSDRIRLGFIGVGNRGGQNLGTFLKMLDRVDIVALCDVDSSHLADAQKKVEAATKKKCAEYGDYRKLLDDKNIDAVVDNALPTIGMR